ncbi:MAG: hypothetical protein AAFV92_14150, partial [Pseudomonadota bacterium]
MISFSMNGLKTAALSVLIITGAATGSSAESNRISIQQFGTLHSLGIGQNGQANRLNIIQRGQGNLSVQMQDGRRNGTNIDQTGRGNGAAT